MIRAAILAAFAASLAVAPAPAAQETADPGRTAQAQGAGRPSAAKPAQTGAVDAKPADVKPADPKAAAPRGGALLPGGESRDPIVIDADKLEWFDKEQKAIYTGNVVATQGEATLKASQLRIFMLKPEKGAAAPQGGAVPAGPGVGADNQIERMEADGPVELIQKDQTATGDKGLYERGVNAVTLIGNVSLRQGGHITLGDRLVYDLDTRQAVIQKPRGTFAPRAQPAAPAQKR